jgi:hypothetical protein
VARGNDNFSMLMLSYPYRRRFLCLNFHLSSTFAFLPKHVLDSEKNVTPQVVSVKHFFHLSMFIFTAVLLEHLSIAAHHGSGNHYIYRSMPCDHWNN